MTDDKLGLILTPKDFEILEKLISELKKDPTIEEVALNHKDSKWSVVLYGNISNEQLEQYRNTFGSGVEVHTKESIEQKEHTERLLKNLKLGRVYSVNEPLEERYY